MSAQTHAELTHIQVNATLFARIMWAKGFGGAPQDDNEHKWAEQKEFLQALTKWQTFAKNETYRTGGPVVPLAAEGHDLGAVFQEQSQSTVRQPACQTASHPFIEFGWVSFVAIWLIAVMRMGKYIKRNPYMWELRQQLPNGFLRLHSATPF